MLRTTSAPAIKTLLEIIKDLQTRINVTFDAEGMFLSFMDHAHVAMTSVKLRAAALTAYSCQQEVTIGVDAGSWYRYLKSTTPQDVLTLTLFGVHPDVMGIRVENKAKQYVSTAEMRLTSKDEEEKLDPDDEYDIAITMGSHDFLRICREMGSIAGMDSMQVRLDSEDQNLTLSSTGDIGSLQYCILSADEDQPDGEPEEGGTPQPQGVCIHKAEEDFRESFGLRYLITFGKAAQLCNSVAVFLKPQYPMMLKYEFMQDSELRFYIAPKASESDEEEDEAMEAADSD